MGRDDWYRRTTWTPADEEAFRTRNRRSRGADFKAQYLRIQAETLYETGKIDLIADALRLAEEVLREYPDVMDRASALDLAGRCCWRLGDFLRGLRYFLSALERQKEFPGIQTNACFHLGRLVAEERLASQYDVALDALDEFGAPVFPWHVYMADGVRAIIAGDRGDLNAARLLAQRALEASQISDSGLGYRRENIGLVQELDTRFHRRLVDLMSA